MTMASVEAWRSQGKSWSDVPPAIKRDAKAEFKIPSHDIYAKILPPSTASLTVMSGFSFPIQATSPAAGPLSDLSVFFSKEPPALMTGTNIMRLRRLRIPDSQTIRKLVEYSRQAWLDGFTAIWYAHLHNSACTAFPLWIITYWNVILDVRDHVKQWATCKDWVLKQAHQNRSAGRRDLAEEASLLLNNIPWNVIKLSGLSDGERTYMLWRFLGTNWLADSQVNDLLQLLRAKVLSHADWLKRFCVEGVEVTTKVLQGFKAGSAMYQTRADFGWLRSLGKCLFEQKMSLVTVGHLGDLEESLPHWVAIVVDAETGMHRFGDPFHNPIPEELRDTYEWWSKEHGAERLTCDILPTSHQLDSHACGIFAHNALDHHIDPESCPLMNNIDVPAERLRGFNTVAAHILARLPTNESEEVALYETSSDELTWDIEDPLSSLLAAIPSINFTFTARVEPHVSALKCPKDIDTSTPTTSPAKKRTRT